MENIHNTNTHTADFAEAMQPCMMSARCPLQILVIDHINGPAHTLTDVFSRVFETRVCYYLATNAVDVQAALLCAQPDLVLVGLEERSVDTVALLPDLRRDHPQLPIMAIGHDPSCFAEERGHLFGVDEVVALPQRAAELKSLVGGLAERYL